MNPIKIVQENFDEIVNLFNSKIKDKEKGVQLDADISGSGFYSHRTEYQTFHEFYGINEYREEKRTFQKIVQGDSLVPSKDVEKKLESITEICDILAVYGFNRNTGKSELIDRFYGHGLDPENCDYLRDDGNVLALVEFENEFGKSRYNFRPVENEEQENDAINKVVEALSKDDSEVYFHYCGSYMVNKVRDVLKACGLADEDKHSCFTAGPWKLTNGSILYYTDFHLKKKHLPKVIDYALFIDSEKNLAAYSETIESIKEHKVPIDVIPYNPL